MTELEQRGCVAAIALVLLAAGLVWWVIEYFNE